MDDRSTACRIAVVVPVYRVEAYLRRCVDSILTQTYRDYEVILIDDGSPDGCGRICDEYAVKSDRVSVIHRTNGGLSAARNSALEKILADGRCDAVTFIDSDDWVDPDYLQVLVTGFRTGADMSAVGFSLECGKGECVRSTRKAFRTLTPAEFWRTEMTNPYTAWGKLFNVEAFRTLRYPEGRLHEDQFLAHRLVFGAKSIACTGTPLYRYFRRADSICGKVADVRHLDRLDVWEEEIRFFEGRGLKALADESRLNLIEDSATGLRLFRKRVWRFEEHQEEFWRCRRILRHSIRELRLSPIGRMCEYRRAWPAFWPVIALGAIVRGWKRM